VRRLVIVLLCLVLNAVVLVGQQPPPAPIVVQGAMTSETEQLVRRLEGATREEVGSWNFWRGTIDGYPVIVSKTNKGAANAAAATMLAIERFRPLAIVNQGTSGGHDPALKVYDIVIGTTSLNIGAFKTPHRLAGAGSRPIEWLPRDLRLEGSAGGATMPQALARFEADSNLLAVARGVRSAYSRGRVVDGVIGSSDMWIDEVDYVTHLRASYGTSVEEMETAAAAQVAAARAVPFLGIRILSDNITNGGAYDPRTGEACQEFVHTVVKTYISTLRR
jgi:adenosylhomocysteine nucleosidase